MEIDTDTRDSLLDLLGRPGQPRATVYGVERSRRSSRDHWFEVTISLVYVENGHPHDITADCAVLLNKPTWRGQLVRPCRVPGLAIGELVRAVSRAMYGDGRRLRWRRL